MKYPVVCPMCDTTREVDYSTFCRMDKIDGSIVRQGRCTDCYNKNRKDKKQGKKTYKLYCPKCDESREISRSSFYSVPTTTNSDGSRTKLCVKHCKVYETEDRTCEQCGKTEEVYTKAKKSNLCKACIKKDSNKRYRARTVKPTVKKDKKPKENKWHPLDCSRCGQIKHYKVKEDADHDTCKACRVAISTRCKGTSASKPKKGYQPISKKPDAKPKRKKISSQERVFQKLVQEFDTKPKPPKDMETRPFTTEEQSMIDEFLSKRKN